MNIYKISCVSDCGSYFGSYLQSVTVVAQDEKGAIEFTKNWMAKPENPSFIYPYEWTKSYKNNEKKQTYIVKWDVELLLADIGDKEPAIIDTFEDSDY